MKIKFTIFSLILIPLLGISQTKVNANWTKIMGGSNYENPVFPYYNSNSTIKSTLDSEENILVATSTFSTDLSATYGSIDVYVFKLNSKGDTLWTVVFGGSFDDISKDIVSDGNGGCIVVGYTYSDDGLFANTGHHGDNEREDGFAAFIDKDGKITAIKQYGGKQQYSQDAEGNEIVSGGYDALNSIIATSDGNFMCVGYTNSYTDDLGPLDVTQFFAGWFLKISPTGKKISSKKISLDIDEPEYYLMKLYGVVQNEDGNYVAFGDVANMNTFLWAVKTDGIDNTNKIWSETYSAETIQTYGGFVKKQDGNYAACVTTVGGAGDLNKPGMGAGDVWVFEIDNQDGSMLNQNLFGGAGGDIAKDLICLKNGNLLVSGSTNSTDGDAFGGFGDNDFWMLELHKDRLDTVRMHKFGGSGYDALYSTLESKDGHSFYVAGMTDSNDPAEYGYVHENNGGTDVFVAKIEADPTLSVDKISADNKTFECIPTSETGVYSLLNAKNTTVSVCDILGKQVLSKKVNSDKDELNLKNCGKGIYIVKLNDNFLSCKIIIE